MKVAEVYYNEDHTCVYLRVNGKTVLCIDADGKLHVAQKPEKDWSGDFEAFSSANLRLRKNEADLFSHMISRRP